MDLSWLKTPPRPHQVAALEKLNHLEGGGLFLRTGRGKTKTTLDDAALCAKRGEVDLIVVATLTGVQEQWIYDQAPAHMSIPWRGLVLRAPSKQTKAYQKELEDVLSGDDIPILACHFELFTVKKFVDWLRDLMKRRRVFFVVDEGIAIRNHKAVRTKTLIGLGPLAARRRLLTGTPISKGIENLWGQMSFVRRDLLGRSFYAFRNRYCELEDIWGAPKGAKKIVGYVDVDHLMSKVAPYVHVDDDAKPPKRMVRRYVPLTDQQRRMYEDMREEGVAEFADGGFVVTTNSLERLVRLQQIVCGHSKDFDGRLVDVPSERAKVAADVVEEIGSHVIMWHRFDRDADLISTELDRRGVAWVEYSGRVSSDDRRDARFAVEEGRVPVLLAKQQSAGRGLDMPRIRASVFYSNLYDSELRWQAEDRQRPGMIHQDSLYVDLVARGTIDETILDVVAGDLELAEMVKRMLRDGV